MTAADMLAKLRPLAEGREPGGLVCGLLSYGDVRELVRLLEQHEPGLDGRGLQETITAQAQRLAELAKLYDLAFEAKRYLAGEHQTERKQRQELHVAVEQARVVISDLRILYQRLLANGEWNFAAASAMAERADAWLEAHPETS